MGDSNLKIARLLGSANWDLWAIRMEAVLIEKGYYEVMVAQPEENPSPEAQLAHLQKQKRALAYIRLALSDGPLLQTRNITDPCLLWTTLKSLYEPKGFSSEFLLCKQLFETSLAKEGNSIEDYLNRIKRLTDDLAARNLVIPNKVIAAWTLNNLTTDYENTVAMISQQFRNTQQEIDLNELFAHLIDESRRLKSKDPDEMAMISQKKENTRPKKDSSKSKPGKSCKHCKKTNHLESKCWIKHPELHPKKKKSEETKPNQDKEEEEVSLILQENALISTNQNYWTLDSGATSHICCNKSLFTDLTEHSTTLNWGSANCIRTSGIGTVRIRFTSTNQAVILNNCLLVPELGVNLLSLGTLVQKGVSVAFSKRTTQMHLGNRLLAEGFYQNKLSTFRAELSSTTKPEMALISAESTQSWHERLGHIGSSALQKLPKAVEGCEIDESKSADFNSSKCEICIQAKMTKQISRIPSTPHYTYLELVHSDICGPIFPETIKRYRYFATFLDSATKWATVELLRTKDDVIEALKKFVIFENNQSSLSVKRIHQDNGKEYKNGKIQSFLTQKGIEFTYSAPYSPEQNGSAERLNRTLLNKVRAMLYDSPLRENLEYWGEALLAATYLYNRTPHSALAGHMTPYQAKNGTKPDLANIRKWGSIAYKKIAKTKKLEEKATKFILIGYNTNQYKLLDPETAQITWARDVTILERALDPEASAKRVRLIEEEEEEDEEIDEEVLPRKNFIDQLTEASFAYISEIGDPTTFNDAKNGPNWQNWQKAMEIELAELNRQKTWILVEPSSDRKILSGRWVFKTKLDQNGQPIKYKARWVAKGFMQKHGFDFFETFANTARPALFRTFFALAAQLNWEIHQWDVKSAFPNANLEEKVYMRQPVGFEDGTSKVCLLQKALYGLKQSARQWQLFLTELLAECGLVPTKSDQAIFISKEKPVIIAAHIDDLLIFSEKIEFIDEIRQKLKKKVDLTNLGEAKFYLGIEIIRDRVKSTLILTQRTFLKGLLEKYAKIAQKSVKNPCQLGVKLEASTEQASDQDIHEYQVQIGSLMYLMTATRPDLAYPLGLAARFMSNPNPLHQKALDRIWQYLAYTADFGLVYQKSSTQQLDGYCDSDWGGDLVTRKSTTGYLFRFGTSAVSWNSSLQKTVALSSCEAEYMALKEAIKEQIYLQNSFGEIPNLKGKFSRNLFTDSQSAINLAKNPVYHKRTKHVEIQYHFVRDTYMRGEIQLVYIPTENQIADSLTKSVDQKTWDYFTDQLGLIRVKNPIPIKGVCESN